MGEQSESILQQIWPDIFSSSSPPTSTVHFTYCLLLPDGTQLTATPLLLPSLSTPPHRHPPARSPPPAPTSSSRHSRRGTSAESQGEEQGRDSISSGLLKSSTDQLCGKFNQSRVKQPVWCPCPNPHTPRTSVLIVSPVQFAELSVLAKINNISWLNKQTYPNILFYVKEHLLSCEAAQL